MITTTDRRKLFRMSAAPGKEKCGHFEPTISTSPNAARGTEIHADLSARLPTFFKNPARRAFIDGEKPYFKYALKILDESGLKEITGVERLVELYDREGNFVTEGTLDLDGLNQSDELMVYDWKSGQERDYSAQVTLYSLSRMQRKGFKTAWLHEVFLDQERTYVTQITRELAEERAFKIVENARNPTAPHVINRYCDYCDLQHDCPAWRVLRKRVDVMFSNSEEIIKKASLDDRIYNVLSDPELLSGFIQDFKRIKKYIEKNGVETHALTLMKNGTKLTGLRLAKHPSGSQYIALE